MKSCTRLIYAVIWTMLLCWKSTQGELHISIIIIFLVLQFLRFCWKYYYAGELIVPIIIFENLEEEGRPKNEDISPKISTKMFSKSTVS